MSWRPCWPRRGTAGGSRLCRRPGRLVAGRSEASRGVARRSRRSRGSDQVVQGGVVDRKAGLGRRRLRARPRASSSRRPGGPGTPRWCRRCVQAATVAEQEVEAVQFVCVGADPPGDAAGGPRQAPYAPLDGWSPRAGPPCSASPNQTTPRRSPSGQWQWRCSARGQRVGLTGGHLRG